MSTANTSHVVTDREHYHFNQVGSLTGAAGWRIMVHSKGQDQGYAHLYCEYLINTDIGNATI